MMKNILSVTGNVPILSISGDIGKKEKSCNIFSGF
jgi:hypothetical protein